MELTSQGTPRKNRAPGVGLSAVDVEKVKRRIWETAVERPRFNHNHLLDDLKDEFPNGTLEELKQLIRLTVGTTKGNKAVHVKKGSVVTVYSILCDCGKVHKIIAERY